MDKAALEEHLAVAERHIVQGEKLVTQQRQIVGELERYRLDSAVARDLLATLEKSLALHIADHDRLHKELGFGQSEKLSPARAMRLIVCDRPLT